ncbi:MAG: type I secretion system permease/ATPase [Thermosynechococcaceae cyanobacterium MS004]|nr:type I secretion system permease/ATPase [Thermosynechococcaceae cyanobacterium MS004]
MTTLQTNPSRKFSADPAAFLQETTPFDRLSESALSAVLQQGQLLRYAMGQPILVREQLPPYVAIIIQGQARLIGYPPTAAAPISLQRLESGDCCGWVGLVRQMACETVIASVETVCFTLPAALFGQLLYTEPAFAKAFCDRCGYIECFDLLGQVLQRRADGATDLSTLTAEYWPQIKVHNWPKDGALDESYQWVCSSASPTLKVGQPFNPAQYREKAPLRLVSLPQFSAASFAPKEQVDPASGLPLVLMPDLDIPLAPELSPDPLPQQKKTFPVCRGSGAISGTLACFQMLAQYWGLPFRRDTLRRIISQGGEVWPSLQSCGAIADFMGLKVQHLQVSADRISRLPTPALISWQSGLAVLYQATPKRITLATPDQGLKRFAIATFQELWGETGEVLLLQPTDQTPKQRFGLSWFWPSVKRYRWRLFEVLAASLFVQIFALANPLGVQIIIDKVLVQNSPDTLNVLGTILLVLAIFEALLTSFRTYLFVETTNRIDLSLGSDVVEHLLRLPLQYFERRPVGELSTRVNELENIRQFLTGTALTVVLDAVFSVVYIIVMVAYSWLLTLVALATVPLFGLLTFCVAPLMRNQLRAKAERNAQTQSYFVEVISGIQTVKAQNIELKARWQWLDRYANYVSTGFQSVITSTAAGSISNFLSKLSGLLLLWVGAFLVLGGQLTLGELIAFRIIASYTTSPLLRLIQLWQNFQETALSLERLSDILDTPPEVTEEDRQNIPMPLIQGSIRYEAVSFSYTNGPLQLDQVSLDIEPGEFIGLVGLSGSGKSTVTKLLMRLYPPQQGRILVDDYDIAKVELYSLRRQIGMVLQDSLLFNGTVQENITLAAPEATTEEIVQAAKIAYAHDFIMQLPQGYNTRVGERGGALSGGQRQRIAIARMVLQNPRLLILDEATSALDFDAESQICRNLQTYFHDRTILFITHRLKSLQIADRIIMIDRGRVAEQGTHVELMEHHGLYYSLYRQQDSQG